MRFMAYCLLLAAVPFVLTVPASAVTIDYSGAANANGALLPAGYGSTSSVALSYRTLSGLDFSNPGTPSANHVSYWETPGYSQDQAIYASANGNTLDLRMDASPGLKITQVAFSLGSWPNTSRTTSYKVFDQNWNQLAGSTSLLVSGNSGADIIVMLINASSITFRMGTDWNVGLRSINYTLSSNAPSDVPVPGALLLLGTAVTGLGGFSSLRRRRKTQAIA